MTTKAKQNGAATDFDISAYRLPPVYEWVECEKDEINEGLTKPLRIRVLVNPTKAEVVSLGQQVSALFQQSADLIKTAIEARKAAKDAPTEDDIAETVAAMPGDEGQKADTELFALVAPRVVQWNVKAERTDGETVDLPPPADTNGTSMQVLNVRQQLWIVGIVQNAHHGGETRSKLSRRPEATAAGEDAKTPSGPQVGPTPTTASRRTRQPNC
jgi:hypothetical protein